MDSVVAEKVRNYLRDRVNLEPIDCATVVERIRQLARMGGYDLNERFAVAGLGAGPEARIAATVVSLALNKSGSATNEHDIRLALEKWIREVPALGA